MQSWSSAIHAHVASEGLIFRFERQMKASIKGRLSSFVLLCPMNIEGNAASLPSVGSASVNFGLSFVSFRYEINM